MLPFESCRKQTSSVESVKAHIPVGDGIDAAQPTSISLVTALPHSCSSLPALSCGSEEAAAGARRKSTQRMFAILSLFVVFLFPVQCSGAVICHVLS